MDSTPIVRPDSMPITQTEVVNPEGPEQEPPVLRLRLTKPKKERKVGWRADTIDNEHMNKKKSKCCCIYKKPVAFGESSSEDDEECEHCFGHPEKRRKNRSSHDHDHNCDGDHGENPTSSTNGSTGAQS